MVDLSGDVADRQLVGSRRTAAVKNGCFVVWSAENVCQRSPGACPACGRIGAACNVGGFQAVGNVSELSFINRVFDCQSKGGDVSDVVDIQDDVNILATADICIWS